ncbi:MAG: hypothetical protein ACYC8T_27035, partial [Myxococcaceae bacterium]
MRFLIGIDDTDANDSIGTGALARELSARLERDLGVLAQGITRHQLLVHPDIPYTSHNSSACIAVDSEQGREVLAAACREFIVAMFHPGADPGLCIGPVESLACTELADFGRSAQREVLKRERAEALGRGHGLLLEPLGGTGLGIVGALAGCALRATQDDGRFIALPGARLISGSITVRALLAKLRIDAVIDAAGEELG